LVEDNFSKTIFITHSQVLISTSRNVFDSTVNEFICCCTQACGAIIVFKSNIICQYYRFYGNVVFQQAETIFIKSKNGFDNPFLLLF